MGQIKMRMQKQLSEKRSAALAMLIVSVAVGVAACGGGGSAASPGSANSTPTTPPPVASTLPRLFAGLTASDGTSTAQTYLKACYFLTQKVGAKGQRGLDFLESFVVEKLAEPTALLYNATDGTVHSKTNRVYKGTDGKVGAPPSLWTGVVSLNADGSANGFGAPCTPTTMVELPKFTCYWLTDNLNGRVAALNYYDSIGDGRPLTNSGTTPPENPGWGTGIAYYFWYEMGPGASCSAPESTTLWRSLKRCADVTRPACN